MWQVLLTDVIQISKQVAEQTNQLHSIALQSSLPRIIKVRKNLVQTLFMKKNHSSISYKNLDLMLKYTT